MGAKRAPAKDVYREDVPGQFWIDHAQVVEDDLEWLGHAERLTMWNVRLPEGFLARLEQLWFLDVRGGTGTDVDWVRGCSGLRGLVVNQVRGITDLSAISDLATIELLQLYGLPRVARLPSLGGLERLRRLEVGSMKGLESLMEIREAPALEILELIRKVPVTEEDLSMLRTHPTLREFDWFAEDVPDKTWVPVQEAMAHLPRPRACRPEEWFEHAG